MGNHAKIAMIGFGRMDKERRRAGRGERCCNLRADMPALADTGDNHPALASRQRLDCRRKRLGQAIVERFDQAFASRQVQR